MIINDLNIKVDRNLCIACGTCVDRCIMDNLRLAVAPCRQACPLETNCQGYLRYLAQGKEKEAAEELRKHTPFANILGRVCTQPCESACEHNNTTKDGAVHIRAVKRYLAERYPEITQSVSKKAALSYKNVAIVGSGAAGLAAANELAANGHSVTIYESANKAGGVMRYCIPSYRLPENVVDQAVGQVTALGVEIKTNTIVGQDITIDELRNQHDAVLLAVGLWKSCRPSIPGANLPGVYDAIDMLRCIKEEKSLPKASSAVVIGGGATAMDVALSLRKTGVSVTMITLEAEGTMPVPEMEIQEALEEGVSIRNQWGVSTIQAEGSNLSLELRRCLSMFDSKGNFSPKLDDLASASFQTDMVVFAVGQRLHPALTEVPLNGRRLIGGEESGQIKGMDNVFVAGDCMNGASSLVNAMASGKKVAGCVNRYLSNSYPLNLDSWTESGKVNEYKSDPSRVNGTKRGLLARIPVEERTLTTEVELCLAKEQARKEAERCMSCGRPFDANKTCWSCLPCELDCPTQALTLRFPYLQR